MDVERIKYKWLCICDPHFAIFPIVFGRIFKASRVLSATVLIFCSFISNIFGQQGLENRPNHKVNASRGTRYLEGVAYFPVNLIDSTFSLSSIYFQTI